MTSYYCVDGEQCCGLYDAFNCMSAGGECCAALSVYGYGLWCGAGTTCVVRAGFVQCEDESGALGAAASSQAESLASTTARPSATESPAYTDLSYTSLLRTSLPAAPDPTARPSRSPATTKSKAWIAGAVLGPLLGLALLASLLVLLCVVRKRQRRTKAVHAPGSAPPNTTQHPYLGPTLPPPAAHPDFKTPAYTQQHEIPTPMASPPPRYPPSSPAPAPVSPQPVYAYHAYTNELHDQSIPHPRTPVHDGDGTTPQPQPVYGNATELPLSSTAQPAGGGAQELHG